MVVQRARDNVCAFAFCALVGGQDELVFDGHSLVFDHDGDAARARRASSSEELLVCDVDLARARAAERLRDPRHRPVRAARAAASPLLASLAMPRRAARSTPPAARPAGRLLGRRPPRSTRRSSWACTTTSRRTASATSCSASPAASTRRSSRRSPSTRSGAERVSAAVMPSPSPRARRRTTRARWPRARHRGDRAPDRRAPWRLRRAARGRVRRPRRRHHRGEPAGADPRQPADGALQQVRLARADDGQQVGDVGRLLDALRRPRGRLRRDQGRPEDARLRAGAPAQRDRRRRHPAIPASIIERAPSAELRPDQRDEDSLPPYDVLDAILAATSRTTSGARS